MTCDLERPRLTGFGVILLLSLAIPASGQDTDAVRYVSGETRARLDTAVAEFEDIDTGRLFRVVSVLRCGDSNYIEAIRKMARSGDLVLTEDFGGPERVAPEAVAALDQIQDLAAQCFGLRSTGELFSAELPETLRSGLDAEAARTILAARGLAPTPAAQTLSELSPALRATLRFTGPALRDNKNAVVRKGLEVAARSVARLIGQGPALYKWLRRPEDRKRDELLAGLAADRILRDLDERLSRDGLKSVTVLVEPAHWPELVKRLGKRPSLYVASRTWMPAWTIGGAQESEPR